MKTSLILTTLRDHPGLHLRFLLPDGGLIPLHAHVTEVGRVDKTFLDCGGTTRRTSYLCLQTWVADDTDHRLSSGKLAAIIERAAPILGEDDLDVEIEYEEGFITQLPDAADVPVPMKPLVLILCTGNSCRSHLAEGILRAAAGDLIEVASAGSKPAGYVHPKSIEVLEEIGIDISAHHSKHMDEFLNRPVDTVITVCGNADQACPMFPGQLHRYHWGFDDPAHATGSEEDVLKEFRRVRDQIRLVFEAYASGLRRGKTL